MSEPCYPETAQDQLQSPDIQDAITSLTLANSWLESYHALNALAAAYRRAGLKQAAELTLGSKDHVSGLLQRKARFCAKSFERFLLFTRRSYPDIDASFSKAHVRH